VSQTGTIYLIHFDEPLSHARHYIGWTQDEMVRVELHQGGRGSRLLAAVQAQGIPWRVVRRWRGTRDQERYLKNQRHGPAFCPVCSGRVRSPRWPTSRSGDPTEVKPPFPIAS
jgi:predicted GIY-YIG superfamily endonuclease